RQPSGLGGKLPWPLPASEFSRPLAPPRPPQIERKKSRGKVDANNHRSCKSLGGKHPFTSPQQGARYFIRANQELEIRARLTREAAPWCLSPSSASRGPRVFARKKAGGAAVSAGSWFCSANGRFPRPRGRVRTRAAPGCRNTRCRGRLAPVAA